MTQRISKQFINRSEASASRRFSRSRSMVELLDRRTFMSVGVEISVAGNGRSILDGDSTPSLLDHTDFGAATLNGAQIERTFTIFNTGTENMYLNGPFLPSGFIFSATPGNPVQPGTSSTFRVRMTTTSAGVKAGQIEIYTADIDEARFNFSITGTVTSGATVGDPDDQISEATSLGQITATRSASTNLSTGSDVDMFSFTVTRRQRIAFDVDRPSMGGLSASFLRIFNAEGTELARDSNTLAPREGDLGLSFREYTFTNPGTYFVAVSASSNTTYNPLSGSGDVPGLPGQYSITLTPITRVTTPVSGVNEIGGKLAIPNPTGVLLSEIGVSLRRIDTTGSTAGLIEPARQTWIVIHGRASRSSSMQSLAGAIDGYKPDDQVLVLDWRDGAGNNYPSDLGLQGAQWIPYVAHWTANVLRLLGVGGSSAFLVGHSWGSFIAHDAARAMPGGKVKGLVALDPALLGAQSNTVFANAAYNSWAFYGSKGWFGSVIHTVTAHESYVVEFAGGQQPNDFQRHNAPVHVFMTLVRRSQEPNAPLRASLFGLAQLENPSNRPVGNGYGSGFEGRLEVRNSDSDNDWGERWSDMLSFRYRPSGSTELVTI